MTAMTISDTERREVAERLREIELSKSGYVAWWKIAKALKLKQLDGWFGWEKFDPDSAKRLADLIDPDCEEGRTCQIVVSVDRNPASYGGRVHRCSSCGKALPGALFRNGWTQLDYCPRCGSRVTEVVRDGD